MTAVAASSIPGPVRAEGGTAQESKAGSKEFSAEVARAEPPERQPKEQAAGGQGSGSLVADRPKTEAAEVAATQAAQPQPEARSKTESRPGAKVEPSHLATVNGHSGQLGSMRGAIADAEAHRGSQTMGMQAINNGLSFVNGERRNWEQANTKVGAYEEKLNAFASGAKDAPSADALKAARRDAETAVQAYTGQAVANDAASGKAAASTIVRGQGLLKAGGGALQTATGVGMLAAPEPTMLTKVGGGLAVAKGADDVQAGLRQALTGEETDTLTHEGSAALARGLGADKAEAQRVGGAVDLAAGVGVPVGLVQRIGANMDEGMRLIPAAAKAGKDAVGDGIETAKDFGRGLFRRGDAPPPGPAAAPDPAPAPGPPAAPATQASPEPVPLNPDNLLAGAEPLDAQRYPGMSQMRLPNGATATVSDEFQRTRLHKHFLNDVQDVIRFVDGQAQSGGHAVTTRSGKTIEGEFLGTGAESRAYRFGDDLVVKVKTSSGDIYEPPTDRFLAMQDLKNAPEAQAWARDHNLHVGETLLTVQGPDDAAFNSDLMVQPFYPSSYLQSLGTVPGHQGIKAQMDDVLHRNGHASFDADEHGANLAVRRDRATGETSRTFFDPVIGEGDVSNNAPSAWRRYDVDPDWARRITAERAAKGQLPPPIPLPPRPGRP